MAYSRSWTVTLGGQSPQEIEGVLVTCNYFDVLQLRPPIGTGFTAANCEAPTASPSVILSHALWTREFAADPDIVLKTVTLNGQDVSVVGVAAEGFDGIDIAKAAFFAPVSLQRILLRSKTSMTTPASAGSRCRTPDERQHPGAGAGGARGDCRPNRSAAARTNDEIDCCAGDSTVPARCS